MLTTILVLILLDFAFLAFVQTLESDYQKMK